MRCPAWVPASLLFVPMCPSMAAVTLVSAVMTLIPALRAASMDALSASLELGAMTIALTPRETEFSTSCTCPAMSVSDVGPNVPTVTPKSVAAASAPASRVCQYAESVARMMTSTFWPDAAPPLPPPPPVALPEEVALPTTTPATTATRAIAATKDRENTVLDCAIALYLVFWACFSCRCH